MGHQRRISAVWFTVNRACNNRCKWCYAQDTEFSDLDNMSLETLESLAVICRDLEIKSVMLIGGEPTLYPHLENAIRICLEHDVHPHLITNGRRFKDRAFTERMAAVGLKSVSISVKAADRAQHIQLTGVDGYDDVRQGIQELIRAGINIGLSITITKTMMEDPRKLVESIAALGRFELFVEFANPAVANGVVITEEVPMPQEIADYCVTLHPLFKEYGVSHLLNVGIPLCLFPDDFLEEVAAEQRIMSVCHVRSGSGTIFLQNGDVIPCHQFLGNELGRYGEDFTAATDFTEFWNGPKVDQLVEAFNYYPIEECAKCSRWEICGGGCMMKWFAFDPKAAIVPPAQFTETAEGGIS